jgi:hypothetical protein
MLAAWRSGGLVAWSGRPNGPTGWSWRSSGQASYIFNLWLCFKTIKTAINDILKTVLVIINHLKKYPLSSIIDGLPSLLHVIYALLIVITTLASREKGQSHKNSSLQTILRIFLYKTVPAFRQNFAKAASLRQTMWHRGDMCVFSFILCARLHDII